MENNIAYSTSRSSSSDTIGWKFKSINPLISTFCCRSNPVDGISISDLETVERYSLDFGPLFLHGVPRHGSTEFHLEIDVKSARQPFNLMMMDPTVSVEQLKIVWKRVVEIILELHSSGSCHGELCSQKVLVDKGDVFDINIEPCLIPSNDPEVQRQRRNYDLEMLESMRILLPREDGENLLNIFQQPWSPSYREHVEDIDNTYVSYFRECLKMLVTLVCEVAPTFPLETLYLAIELLHRCRRLLLTISVQNPRVEKYCLTFVGAVLLLAIKMVNRELQTCQIAYSLSRTYYQSIAGGNVGIQSSQYNIDPSDIVKVELQIIVHLGGRLPRRILYHECTSLNQCIAFYQRYIILATETTNYFRITLNQLSSDGKGKVGALSMMTVRDIFG